MLRVKRSGICWRLGNLKAERWSFAPSFRKTVTSVPRTPTICPVRREAGLILGAQALSFGGLDRQPAGGDNIQPLDTRLALAPAESILVDKRRALDEEV
jgi:hypothetical protein